MKVTGKQNKSKPIVIPIERSGVDQAMPGVNGNEQLLMTPWGYTGAPAARGKAKEKRTQAIRNSVGVDSK